MDWIAATDCFAKDWAGDVTVNGAVFSVPAVYALAAALAWTFFVALLAYYAGHNGGLAESRKDQVRWLQDVFDLAEEELGAEDAADDEATEDEA